MPKKFVGENTKAVAARERKKAAMEAAEEKKKKVEEDAFWADDDKLNQRKVQRKEDKMKKKQEMSTRKALNKQLLEEEMTSVLSSKPPTSTVKITRAQISINIKQKENEKAEKPVMIHEEPITENINRVVVDGVDARNVDEAISVLSLNETEIERHPERRMKAAYLAFEQANLPKLKASNPNLRLSQLKQLLKRDWLKSPENPLNQSFAAYNASRSNN